MSSATLRPLHRYVPITAWGPRYQRQNLKSDLIAGFTISALLIPQGLAYALLAGLPPQVGLYASIAPVIAYAIFGTSRQLAVGPVAIVSLMTATTLGKLYEQGSDTYLASAAVLALLVGGVHLVLRFGRLGFVTNFLSHSVLVGFTAASAVIIVASQIKHVLGIQIPRTESVLETTIEVGKEIDQTHLATLLLGGGCIAAFLLIKRYAKKVPAALVVLLGSLVVMQVFQLEDHGVKTVGDIPSGLPGFSIPTFDGGALGSLTTSAVAITLVGFMESIAVAKVYGRRHRYPVDANQELFGLGMANITSGLFGGYPVTGGFSRTAVADSAGARTALASIVAAILIIPAVLFLTPVFSTLPQAALGATIIVAVLNLVDIKEMRHIAKVKRSDLIGLGISFGATLVLGIERGMVVAIVASMLVVFARMSRPHTATLGRIPSSTSFRNVERFGSRDLRRDPRRAHRRRPLVRERAAVQATRRRSGGARRRHRATRRRRRLHRPQRHRRHRRRRPVGDHHRTRRGPGGPPPLRRQGSGPRRPPPLGHLGPARRPHPRHGVDGRRSHPTALPGAPLPADDGSRLERGGAPADPASDARRARHHSQLDRHRRADMQQRLETPNPPISPTRLGHQAHPQEHIMTITISTTTNLSSTIHPRRLRQLRLEDAPASSTSAPA
ncbi:MAG: sulfate permease [Ilumatobacteraceae bacterium]